MKQIRNGFSIAMLMAFLPMMLAFNTCRADLRLELVDSFNFTKSSATIENQDRDKFEGTALTTGWSSNKKIFTYQMTAEAIWIDDSHFYGLLAGSYGWVLGGKAIEYPLNWNINGHVKGFGVEVGYILNVCKNFDFIPHFGFSYGITNTKIKSQHYFHTSPNCIINRDGNKSHTLLYSPYIGLEVAFQSTFCNKYKVSFSAAYDFGYGSGRGRNTVPHFILTDDPGTSQYGSRVTYHDIITHHFDIAAGHSFADHWQVFLELGYSTSYNTHKLPVKLQHNQQIVNSGQFTRTQYHVMSDFNSQTYSVILGLVYKFSAEGSSDLLVR